MDEHATCSERFTADRPIIIRRTVGCVVKAWCCKKSRKRVELFPCRVRECAPVSASNPRYCCRETVSNGRLKANKWSPPLTTSKPKRLAARGLGRRKVPSPGRQPNMPRGGGATIKPVFGCKRLGPSGAIACLVPKLLIRKRRRSQSLLRGCGVALIGVLMRQQPSSTAPCFGVYSHVYRTFKFPLSGVRIILSFRPLLGWDSPP